MNIYTIYDIKADAYLTPFFLPTDGMATRTFSDCANDPQHQFGKHPEDYILWKIATYDDSIGIITPLEKHELLGKAVEYVDPNAPQQLDIQEA